jgi:hypothetical protein
MRGINNARYTFISSVNMIEVIMLRDEICTHEHIPLAVYITIQSLLIPVHPHIDVIIRPPKTGKSGRIVTTFLQPFTYELQLAVVKNVDYYRFKAHDTTV